MKKYFLLLIVSLSISSAFSQKPSAVEKKVIAYIDQHLPDVLNLKRNGQHHSGT
jgi:hypothetical protein